MSNPLTNSNKLKNLTADCENCFALCCVALPYAKSADFAVDRIAGPLAKTCNPISAARFIKTYETKAFAAVPHTNALGQAKRFPKIRMREEIGGRTPSQPRKCSMCFPSCSSSTKCNIT